MTGKTDMMRKALAAGAFLLSCAAIPGALAEASAATALSAQWEELTGADFVTAIRDARNTCVLPFGILEKHGPHLPIGTDLLDVRYAALHAVQKQYAVVFPAYYFGQIFEARHEPGTIAYPAELQMVLLQATTDEMARNGCKKILIVNGHGGNSSFLPYFAQSQLAKTHDYVVYVIDARAPPASAGGPPKKTTTDQHAGESETAKMLIAAPDTVHQDRAAQESGADQARGTLPKGIYTGIWWYTRFPDHYAGDGAVATAELGHFQMDWWVDSIAQAIAAIKNDTVSPGLQQEFYEKATHPLDTKQ